MADSLLASLLSSLDRHSVGGIASALKEPDQLVSRGLRSSIAVLLGSIASKAEDYSMLRSILNLAPTTPDVGWSQGAIAVAEADSPLMLGGRRALSALFGSSESVVTSAVSRDSGLRFGATSKLLAIAAPMVLGFLAKRVRDRGMSMSGLSDHLLGESSAIRNALPPGLSELLWPKPAVAASAVTARPMEERRPSYRWAAALAIAVAALGLFWLLNRARRPGTEISSVATGTASRVADIQRTLPNNVNLTIPASGVEMRFLDYLRAPGSMVAPNTWLTFDRLVFQPGSASLQPESKDQLKDIATIMAAYPKVHLKIGGFTDNAGDPEANLKLSQARADAVVAGLVREGVSVDRLQAVGYGNQFPVADNTTEQGREQNRRVSMLVTQR